MNYQVSKVKMQNYWVIFFIAMKDVCIYANMYQEKNVKKFENFIHQPCIMSYNEPLWAQLTGFFQFICQTKLKNTNFSCSKVA